MALFRRFLAGLSAAALISAGASAAPLTPPSLTTAPTVQTGDLFVVWPVATSGPLENVPWGTMVTLFKSSIAGTYLASANNLSDLTNVGSARTNLGLPLGGSGASVCLTNSACTWSALQTFSGGGYMGASSASAATFNIAPGTAPTTPNNGDMWMTTAGLYIHIGGSTVGPLAAGTTGALLAANNLADLVNVGTARTNLGLGSAAVQNSSAFLQPGNNLSDVGSASSARSNLGLGSAATQASSAFLQPGNNLSDVNSVSSARTNLGLGGAATLNVGTTAGTVAAGNDSRFAGPTQNSQSAAYTFVASDAGGQIYHPSADTTARTWTIPANASVAYAVGTKIEIVNDCSAGVITLNITSDTLEFFPAGTTGSRTFAACAIGTLTKVTSTEWVLAGVGIT